MIDIHMMQVKIPLRHTGRGIVMDKDVCGREDARRCVFTTPHTDTRVGEMHGRASLPHTPIKVIVVTEISLKGIIMDYKWIDRRLPEPQGFSYPKLQTG
jgi:hypothetical protein